ncbi:unnamed protein product [Closterium sp. Naga37s-1]|nr:unnamed protein product [Closterium sp. Naga37s-1]
MEVLGLHGGGSSGGGFSGGGGGGGAGGGATGSGASSQRFFVLAATATRLLAFVGSTSLEATFAPFTSQLPKFIELPASSPLIPSSLHFFGRQQRYAERFAWMAGPGVLFGHLNLNATSSSSSSEPPIQRKLLLPFAKLLPASHISSPDDADDSTAAAAAADSTSAAAVHPIAMAVSEFHLLLLYSDHIKIVNQLSELLVDQLPFHATSLEMAPGGMLGLVADEVASAYYAFCSNNIYEIAVCNEARAMWQVYLNRHDYAMALSFCRTPLQRDRVYAAQAESAFKDGDYERAATFFARTAHQVPFEEVALKFVEAGQQDALRSFLLHKLDHLPKQERAQMTMVATWASEMYLDKINRLLLQLPPDFEKHDSGSAAPPCQSKSGSAAGAGAASGTVGAAGAAGAAGEGSRTGVEGSRTGGSGGSKEGSGVEGLREEYGRVVAAFRAFLSDCKDVLNEATTVKLLASYGREEELVYFAGLKQRHETVIEHFIRQGDADSAIAVLRRPSVPLELLYKFSPALVLLAPSSTVDLWIMSASAASHVLPLLSPLPLLALSFPPPPSQYKFSPALVLLAPSSTVDLWIMSASAASAPASATSSSAGAAAAASAASGFDPRRLIPAIMRCATAVTGPATAATGGAATTTTGSGNQPNEAVRFLEFCVHRLGSRDPAIHNLLLSLYADQANETSLVNFLSWIPPPPPPHTTLLSSTPSFPTIPSSSSFSSSPSPSAAAAAVGAAGRSPALTPTGTTLNLSPSLVNAGVSGSSSGEGGRGAGGATAAGAGRGGVIYDPKFALRVCLERRRMRGCVCVYSTLGMHQEAVALALQIDVALAKREANKAREQDLKRSLWLMIARHVIEQGLAGRAVIGGDDTGRSEREGEEEKESGRGDEKGRENEEESAMRQNVRRAIALLKETEGLLKVEDILPFFPDFTLIDDFKDAVCESLEAYGQEIDRLKAEMTEATRAADTIRRDIQALSQRHVIVSTRESCGVCSRLILAAPPPQKTLLSGSAAAGTAAGAGAGAAGGGGVGGGGLSGAAAAVAAASLATASASAAAVEATPFYVFPCSHAFHIDCLLTHVVQHSDPFLMEHVLELKRQLLGVLETPRRGGKQRGAGAGLGGVEGDSDVVDIHAGLSPIDKVRLQLDEAIASECPFCGSLMVAGTSEPLIAAHEGNVLDAWSI